MQFMIVMYNKPGLLIMPLLCWIAKWVTQMVVWNGYHMKPSKSWLIVKADHLTLANAGCGIGITAEGKHRLGAAIGFWAFVE